MWRCLTRSAASSSVSVSNLSPLTFRATAAARSTKSSRRFAFPRDEQMKVLVVGSGGREHAIVDALSHNSKIRQIYAAPGNGGIAAQARLVPIPADNIR